MSNDLKFSVLLSIYKDENPEYLDECLKSVFLNSVIPNEVVIVEDGPLTRQLYEKLELYSIKYKEIIKRVPIQHNVGLGRALAIGLKECSHNLVARMDADDICMPNRFQLQLAEFDKDANLTLLGSYIDEFDDDPEKTTLTREVPLNQTDILKFARKRNPFNHMTVMFKKDKVLEVGNYRKVLDIGYEDYDLWIRILKAGFKVKNLDISMVKVRTGESMLKRRGNKKRLKTALYFRKYLKDIGFINVFEFFIYSLHTIAFSFSPVPFKRWLYKNILRSRLQE